MRDFIRGESGQGAIEYILLVGGIIVGAIIVLSMYGRLTGTAVNRINSTTDAATSITSSRINASLDKMI
ncbi:MAG: Flp family type IVb pilin [Candidatus Hydrothermarchaeales archaeon]